MIYQDRFLAYCKFNGVKPEIMVHLDSSNHPYMKWIAFHSKRYESIYGVTVASNQDAFTEFLMNLRKQD
jgi:hypothetical protein